MKKCLLLWFLLCTILTLPVWSQVRASHPLVGAINQGTQQQHTYRWSFSPVAGWQWQRHQLSAGPVILLRDFSGTLAHLPRLTGLHLTYRYYLRPTLEKPLQFYAELSSKVEFIHENWNSNYWNSALEEYQDVKQGSREKLWQNYAGLGLNYRLHPKIYLQLGGGIGYSISRLKKIGVTPDTNDQNFDYRGYDPKSMLYTVNLGIMLKLQ